MKPDKALFILILTFHFSLPTFQSIQLNKYKQL